MKNQILLHCCCAVCASFCIEKLRNMDYEVILFYSNSNIDTEDEFKKRLKELEKLANIYRLELVVDEYRHEDWLAAVQGLENEPERGRRCGRCFAFNFNRASEEAERRRIPFTTTLSISPHKDSKQLMTEGTMFENFEFFNFKKQNGYLETLALAKAYNLYRQNYCGCEFSKQHLLDKLDAK